MKAAATITTKGQVTIPLEIRRKLRLKAGQRIIFSVEDGSARIIPEPSEPLQELRRLREYISCSGEELAEMVRESKASWDSIENDIS